MYANISKRILAFLTDIIIISLIAIFIIYSFRLMDIEYIILIWFFIFFVYFILFFHKLNGQSFGGRLLGIKVVSLKKPSIGMFNALLRTSILASFMFCMGFVGLFIFKQISHPEVNFLKVLKSPLGIPFLIFFNYLISSVLPLFLSSTKVKHQAFWDIVANTSVINSRV